MANPDPGTDSDINGNDSNDSNDTRDTRDSGDTGDTGTDSPSLDEPSYRRSVVELLGVLAYGELTAFERLAADCALAPSLADKSQLGAMATAEFGHYNALGIYLRSLGVDPEDAMAPFVEVFDSWHESTAPSSWLEGLMKAYVGDNLAADFYGVIAQYLDADTRRLVVEVLGDSGHTEFARERILAAIAEDGRVAGRLALWGRRLMGEALSQAQMVVAQRDPLTELFIGTAERPGMGLGAVAAIFDTITEGHKQRMAALGLDA